MPEPNEEPVPQRPEPSRLKRSAPPPYFVVSLQEAFRVFALVRARGMPLHRGRTTLIQRSSARLKQKDRRFLTLLDIAEDAISPRYSGDVEAEDRARFIHELRFGALPAIGYLSPRTE